MPRATGERLRFDITSSSSEYEPPSRTWRDDDKLLDGQLGEIVHGILLHAGEQARQGAVWSYEWELRERARKVEEVRVAAERAEAERTAHAAVEAKACLAALMDGTDALERAEQIRRYVTAVREKAAAERPNTATSVVLERWAAWALAKADALDPVLSKRFVEDLRAHVG